MSNGTSAPMAPGATITTGGKDTEAGHVDAGELIGGKYRLLSLLGRGGMGAVWRAHDVDLDAPVALKLLDPAIALHSEGLARFHREAEAAAAIRSPHVVQIFARGIDAESRTPFIAMELLEGESLAERLKRAGKLDPEQTVRVLTHVARALARAHQAGIVHRDLKPDNVFLIQNDDEEIAKVLDFGIAKSDRHRQGDSGTRTGAVIGTPYYMSPEQIRGSRQVDFRTDIWALGVIACECLTGRRPFDAESHGDLAVKICVDPIPRPRELGSCPPDFDAWFERAVTRDPAERFASAREAASELRTALGLTDARATLERPNAAPRQKEAATVSISPFTQTSEPVTRLTRKRVQLSSLVVLGGAAFAAMVTAALWSDRSAAGDAPGEPPFELQPAEQRSASASPPNTKSPAQSQRGLAVAAGTDEIAVLAGRNVVAASAAPSTSATPPRNSHSTRTRARSLRPRPRPLTDDPVEPEAQPVTTHIQPAAAKPAIKPRARVSPAGIGSTLNSRE